MIRWIPYTFIRTTSFLIGGILLGIFCPDIVRPNIAVASIVLLSTFYLIFFLAGRSGIKILPNAGLIALPAVFLAGYILVLNRTGSRHSDHLLAQTEAISAYSATVNGYAEEKDRTWKVTGEVTALKSDRWHPVTGKVVFYFPKSEFTQPFNYGDVLLVKGSPSVITAPKNPGEFDYRKYLSYKNIYHQHYVRRENVIRIEQSRPNRILFYALQTRLWANGLLHQYVKGEREQSVASALILGVTEGLDSELLQAYASTGAMHVLAVSGLHVSIIYIIILFLLKPLTKFRYGKGAVIFFSLLFLWGYAFVTGLSPSVLRAVTMFSFIAVAKIIARNTNIYNTIAASAFCLLLFDPFLIMSVGFQLSYLAVIGIIYIHPLLYALWEPRSLVMNEVWKITSVSVAAQLATVALGLLYFNQFPNYFILSNLLVIPISFGVLVLGLALIAVGFITTVAVVVGFLLQWLITLLNFSVIAVEWLPFSLIENIYISSSQCWILMAIIICMLLLIQKKNFAYFRLSLPFFLLFAFTGWMHFHIERKSDSLTVYALKGHSAIDLISDGNAFFISDTTLQEEPSKISFHIKPNRLIKGVENVFDADSILSPIPIHGGRAFVWKGIPIIRIDKPGFDYDTKGSVGLVIVGNNALDLSLISSFSRETILVFDGTNTQSYLKKIIGKSSGLQIHSVLRDGAFELKRERRT